MTTRFCTASPDPTVRILTGLADGGDGALYACARGGGPTESGTVYRLADDGELTTLHEFATTDGGGPRSVLLPATDGFLYGTTEGGGANAFGTLFRIHPDGSNFQTVFDFDQDHGSLPEGSLAEASGILYGTTKYGGAGLNSAGSIFQLQGGTLTTLYSFEGTDDGYSPLGGLTLGDDGALYGTTSGGGENFGTGTFFRIDTLGTLTTLFTFHAPEGQTPSSRLFLASDGDFTAPRPRAAHPSTVRCSGSTIRASTRSFMRSTPATARSRRGVSSKARTARYTARRRSEARGVTA